MNNSPDQSTRFFFELTPERVLDAVERLGVRCSGRVMALNSMENRVYEVELDIEPSHSGSRWEAYRVVKFYRPGRWSFEQIQEEHRFLADCREAEIPVVPPLNFADGSTLSEVPGTGIYYAVFQKVGGRILDEMSDSQLRQIGRLLGRLHAVGRRSQFQHRIRLSAESYGFSNLRYLQENKLIPTSVESHYLNLAERIFRACDPWLQSAGSQRLHGDCHIGNILWDVQSCSIVDFDDAVEGPCVQDLWLLTPGRDPQTDRYRELLLKARKTNQVFVSS